LKHPADAFVLDGYQCFYNERTRRHGGGVRMYVKNSFDTSLIVPKFNSLLYEFIWLGVSSKTQVNSKYCICLCYHPPETFYCAYDLSQSILNNFILLMDSNEYDVVILTGDLNNLNCVNIEESLGFSQLFCQLTRAN
jgi:hypothetical protein